MERYVVIDVETTGLVAGPDRVVEVALVIVQRAVEVVTFQSLINPGIPTNPAACRINGLTDKILANAPSPSEVWPQVVKLIGNGPMIAHNANFDRGFVENELQLLGIATPDVKWICTMQQGQSVLGFRPRLIDLVRNVTGDKNYLGEMHRALGDVKALLQVTHRWYPCNIK
jgi:DNA polymerase III epsilon subunit family exonuclease